MFDCLLIMPPTSDINEVCLGEERSIPNTHEKLTKNQSITRWYRCGNGQSTRN